MSTAKTNPRLDLQPPRLTRRRFLEAATWGAGWGCLPRRAGAADPKIILGAGRHRYEWVPGWGTLPAGMTFGNTHGGIIQDGQKNIYMNTDTENAVIVFDQAGKFVRSWGKDFKGGLHGMCIVTEKGKEVLYLAHLTRHEVVKTTLDGNVLMTIPFPEKAGIYKNQTEYFPTGVAVAPHGDIYVGDGYGLSWIHQYDAKGNYIRSWGGKGKEPEQFTTPHGVWVDTRKKTPVLLVCDRGNSRIKIHDLDGRLLGMITENLVNPCTIHQRGQDLVVADLHGRVTIFDKDNKLVEHLGENPDPKKRGQNKIPQDQWRDGEFIAPHCARWDNRGDLYVLDWNFLGRITKLKHLA